MGWYLQTERVQRFMQYAEKQQMHVIQLHTSGHATAKTLHKIVQACKICKVIPMRTKYPECFTNEFDNVKIVQDGEVLLLS